MGGKVDGEGESSNGKVNEKHQAPSTKLQAPSSKHQRAGAERRQPKANIKTPSSKMNARELPPNSLWSFDVWSFFGAWCLVLSPQAMSFEVFTAGDIHLP
jgi:hypothetical protein